MRGPEAPEAAEPRVYLPQRARLHRVQAPGTLRPHGREAGLTQHLQVLRNARLGDPELLMDDGAHRAGGHLPVSEQLQDPAPHRVAEHIEGVHRAKVSAATYISQL